MLVSHGAWIRTGGSYRDMNVIGAIVATTQGMPAFSATRGGEYELGADQQIGAAHRLHQIGEHVAHRRHHQPADDVFRPAAFVHRRAQQFLVGGGEVRSGRVERQPGGEDLLAIGLGGGDDRRVAAALQLQRQRDHRVNVAERSERREDDAGDGD